MAEDNFTQIIQILKKSLTHSSNLYLLLIKHWCLMFDHGDLSPDLIKTSSDMKWNVGEKIIDMLI